MADYVATLVPTPDYITNPIEPYKLVKVVKSLVVSSNYAATVNPAFGQNITELDG